ncbi:hypothetical protein [Paracoccus aminophilus]|uniref:Uncharacterized protein n=1 Tax=Paracoccus aminophilus JCM 7686 TaxID=1367847 RepID=S5YCY4_PARAH|nr:hypothetical protein [Paracoccus aminophilus]AGT09323.1 hypothetical protein JCM7686_2249 [Paracoccus aminophilus JCM 7686]
MTIKLDYILARLPPVPDYFTERHMEIVRSLASVLLRDGTFDEAVWLQVQRYAVHRLKWDDINFDLETDDGEDEKGFGSPKVQRLAYLDKVLTPLERELFFTPASRKEGLGSEQASFMSLLTGAEKATSAPVDPVGAVTPFRPRRRPVGG